MSTQRDRPAMAVRIGPGHSFRDTKRPPRPWRDARLCRRHGIDLPVVSLTDRKLRALYRAWITPQTLVADAEGRVSYARIGAVTNEAVIDSIIAAVPMSIDQLTNRLNR
jgi:hypothetical protein